METPRHDPVPGTGGGTGVEAGEGPEVGTAVGPETATATSPAVGGAHLGLNREYRMAHLGERLAHGDLAELGMRIEARGDTVHITGTASTAADRDAILRAAAEELPGVAVRADIALADVSVPDHTEELP
ncbi:hypothetical protein [Streptomyces ipomoeae]|jgi:hypothetical protein|uniref:BON domain-containing protein n=1 Tax=Streptomyces ipomoeae 91-03 TaxID=698759 RepID=L1KP23_9ACTN|nr:hypothetical protein [Streptomyces ipomoeae]EKX62337.1 hypothetical protein STRIP9103_08681 [Streptomyces ipomoeae 91-03]